MATFVAGFCLALPGKQPPQSSQPAATASDYLYGTWYSYPLGNPATDPIRHEFRHNQATNKDEVIVMRICQGNYRAAIARATSPIEVTQSTIRVLKSASDTQKGELNSECKASVEPGLWSYTVSDDHNHLTITNPGGAPDIMELARQDASVASLLPSNVYGTWSLPIQLDRETQVQIRLVFWGGSDSTKGKVRQIATCTKGNDTLVSQAESDIKISSDHIQILNAASHVQKAGPFTCKVTITPGTLRYVIAPSGTTMTLTAADGPSLKLTRASDASLN
ncbi:MAG TPA: hypothetical protein VGG15_09050 [Terriglobales bacterium]